MAIVVPDPFGALERGGPGFFALDTAFQTQYEELFVAIDEIAERIRALDAYAIGGPGTLAQAA